MIFIRARGKSLYVQSVWTLTQDSGDVVVFMKLRNGVILTKKVKTEDVKCFA